MKLTVSYDPALDAENHVKAIFDAAFMTYGREGLAEKLLDMVQLDEVKAALSGGGERDEVLAKVTAALGANPDRAALEEKARKLEETWQKLGGQVVFQLKALYGADWPFDEVHVDLTTIPMCPYDFKARQIFVHSAPGVQGQLRILAHELNHFMFYWNYAKELMPKLGQAKLELLKESLTVFTNPEQAGKPDEAPLRELYLTKGVRSIDEAVRVGTEYLLSK